MGAIEMLLMHQIRGLGAQSAGLGCRGAVGLLRELPEAEGEQKGENCCLTPILPFSFM